MTVAVLGGTGYLGPEVAARLQAHGREVLVLARGRHPVSLPNGVRFEAVDRMDTDRLAGLLREQGVSAVVDIFALSLRNTQPAIEATAGAGARYVLVSSTDVYSNYGGLLRKESPPVRPAPATEDSPLRTIRYPYRSNSRRPQGVEDDLFEDYDKIPIEEAVRSDTRFPSTIVRLPMIFGPGDKQHRFRWAVEAARAGGPLRIDRRAAGWLNSYGYLTDMAEALALAATEAAAAGRTYNAAQRQVRSVRQWAETLVAAMGLDREVVEVGLEENGIMADRAEAMDLRYPLTLDSTRIREELGYSEVVPEPEALRRTVEWELSAG